MRELLLATTLVAAHTGCSSDTSVPVEPACNPLGAGHCMTPWPSSVFEVDDPATPTGRRLAIPAGALPSNAQLISLDPAGWNAGDGFSPAAPLVMAWKGGVSPDGVPSRDDLDRSLTTDSPTVIVDLTTGARIAHSVELGAPPDDPQATQAVILHPAARLIGGHRYAAGVTDRLRAADGSELAVPIGFAALRDHRGTDHELLEAMRPRFVDVLPALEAAGAATDELVVAWDFTVASSPPLRTDTTAARDRAILAAGYTDPVDALIARSLAEMRAASDSEP
jgi:hypothetical protein